ncbi:MAG: YfhO family protein [Dysgonamonadaceae bacterium]|jgi:hypothetical protein|nr:YfhO family protein [Dysgonamonadaceae bacterium]
MQEIIKKTGKHLLAVAIFTVLAAVYFAPAVFEGKTIRQADSIHATGMGGSQTKQYEETAKPGEFSTWSDAMFGGMPYNAGYGNPAPRLPGIGWIGWPVQRIGFMDAGMVLTGLICFYILMCVMGVSLWAAIAGSIAFAFASYNIIIIEVGHVTKAYVIAYMPLTIAGMFLLFRRKRLWGSILFSLGVILSVSGYHIQITYYLVLLCLFVYIGYMIDGIRKKRWKECGITTAIMTGCVLLALLPNVQSLYTQWELGKTSLRGPTELTSAASASSGSEKISSGLDKDYAFQWSQGRGELLTFLIPNLYGGSSGGTLDRSSEFYQTLRRAGQRVGKEVQAPTYWGDKAFTSGPVYFGAVVCFLFLLGMFVVKNRMKWHLFAGAVFLTLLALGRNLDWFNTFIFYHLPMYNKFRTPEMALVIPGLVFPVIAFWGLKEIVEGKADARLLKKGFIWSLSVTGGICLVVWWFPDLFFHFQSNYDAPFEQQPWYDGLVRDRARLASADALRSLIFVLLSAALVFIFMQLKNKKQGALALGIGFAVLTLADLWPVDKRFLNDKHFANETLDAVYQESVADKEILKDKDLSYRVLTLNNPFQETTVSYFHHSIGGYHAVKLRRYQELIDHRLSGEIGTIIESLRKPQVTMEDIQQSFASTPSLNMLNTRYIIYNPEQPPILNPRAFGNAWFVRKVEIAENADAEIAALNTINPLQTAVVDKRFAGDLKGITEWQPDSAASIALVDYRPNHLIYTSKTNFEQLAVFSEIYYQPGWKAAIDGRPVPHFRADWILRAMPVPAGEHRIEFDFRSESYVVAAYVSSVGSFLLLLLFIAGIGYSIWRERAKYNYELRRGTASR